MYLAGLLLSNASTHHYKKLCHDLTNQFLMGSDNNAKTLEYSIKLLKNYQSGVPIQAKRTGRGKHGLVIMETKGSHATNMERPDTMHETAWKRRRTISKSRRE